MSQPLDSECIRQQLAELGDEPAHVWYGHDHLDRWDLDEASVLIPLFVRDGAWHAIFTERADGLDQHSGEVSFPGGRSEESDATRQATALREAGEEIALSPRDVNVFGVLAEMPTVTGFHIVAYVGSFEMPYELVPEVSEIETIFEAPLEGLADPELHRIETRSFDGDTFPVHFFEYDAHTIWGATGYLLYHLLRYLELIDDRREES